MTQVITIDPSGGMSGLQRKQGQGLDLRQFGYARIKRTSLIQWHEERQRWFIEILSYDVRRGLGYHDGGVLILTIELWREYTSRAMSPTNSNHMQGLDTYVFFEDYDDAVRAEIEFLDALRLRGVY